MPLMMELGQFEESVKAMDLLGKMQNRVITLFVEDVC